MQIKYLVIKSIIGFALTAMVGLSFFCNSNSNFNDQIIIKKNLTKKITNYKYVYIIVENDEFKKYIDRVTGLSVADLHDLITASFNEMGIDKNNDESKADLKIECLF